MGIFFGDVIYGIRYCDLSGDDYVVKYERVADVSVPVDKATIRKILLDESRAPCLTERVFYVYTFYITTYSDDCITAKTHMWRPITRDELVEAGER